MSSQPTSLRTGQIVLLLIAGAALLIAVHMIGRPEAACARDVPTFLKRTYDNCEAQTPAPWTEEPVIRGARWE